eukprot:scaffold13220_cov91-Cylindrotheca_fusiformis.AAC.1
MGHAESSSASTAFHDHRCSGCWFGSDGWDAMIRLHGKSGCLKHKLGYAISSMSLSGDICLIRSVLHQYGSMDAVAGYSMYDPLEIVDNHPPVANALLRDRRFSCPAAGKPRTSFR